MVFKSAQATANQKKLEALLARFVIYPFDQLEAKEFGRVVTELRSVGRPIPAIDMQIAAVALAGNLVLLTADRHFNHVAGLRHENWM